MASRTSRFLSAFVLAVSLIVLIGPIPTARAQSQCTFELGFRVLHDLIPNVVGACVTNEQHNAENGDGLQFTTNGLLVWRKADNWTAFTDGYRTWINGPLGLQSRLNTERFSWEQDGQTRAVTLYFSRRPQSLEDFTAVFPVQRQVQPVNQQVATAAMEALIVGPTAAEQQAGYFSELGGMLSGASLCNGRDFRLSIQADGTAVLQFCRQTSSAGVGQDARVRNQIEATLRQFGTIQRVRVLNRDGQCLFDQSGLNQC
jgi:hypothetical protein